MSTRGTTRKAAVMASSAIAADSERNIVLAPYAKPQKIRLVRRGLLILGLALFCFLYGAAFAIFAPSLMVPFAVPLAFLGALVIWTLPDLDRAPTNLLQGLFFALLVGLVLWPNYLAIALPGLPWITVVRLVSFPLMLVLLISLSVSAPFRAQLLAILRATPWLWKLVCALVVIEAISVAFSSDKGGSIDKLITAQTSWTVVFFTGCFVIAKDGMAERVARLLCVMTVVMGLIAMWEFHLGRVIWVGHIPGFLQVNDPNVLRILTGQARDGHRVQATFSTGIGMAEYVVLATPFLIHFAISRYNPLVRLIAALAVPLAVTIVVVSQARGGFVGLLATSIAYPFALVVLRWRHDRKSLVAAAAVLFSPLGAVTAVAATFIVPGLSYRIWGGGAAQLSTEARKAQVHMGIPKVLSHPWGYGIGEGAHALGFSNAAGVLTIDSYSLRLALEYGLIGFAIYYCLFGAALFYAARGALMAREDDCEARLFIPIGVALLNFVAIQSVFAQEDNQPIAFMLMGMLTALTYRKFVVARAAAGSDAASRDSIAKKHWRAIV